MVFEQKPTDGPDGAPMGGPDGPEAGQYQVESVFLTPPSDSALEEQRERLRVLLDRGALVMALIAVILLVAALLNLVRGNATWQQWLLPFVAGGLAFALYYGSQRLEATPESAVEVPADLAPVLNDIAAARAEIVASGPRVLSPEELSQTMAEVDKHHQQAFVSAEQTLVALRNGDYPEASNAGTDVYQHAEAVQTIRDEIFQEWNLQVTGNEFGEFGGPVDEAYVARPAEPYGAPTGARPVPPSGMPPAPFAGPAPDATRHFWSSEQIDPATQKGEGKIERPASSSYQED